MSVLSVHGLVKIYGRRRVVDDESPARIDERHHPVGHVLVVLDQQHVRPRVLILSFVVADHLPGAP